MILEVGRCFLDEILLVMKFFRGSHNDFWGREMALGLKDASAEVRDALGICEMIVLFPR